MTQLLEAGLVRNQRTAVVISLEQGRKQAKRSLEKNDD